jgi:ATP-dependent DNA helicase RecQ
MPKSKKTSPKSPKARLRKPLSKRSVAAAPARKKAKAKRASTKPTRASTKPKRPSTKPTRASTKPKRPPTKLKAKPTRAKGKAPKRAVVHKPSKQTKAKPRAVAARKLAAKTKPRTKAKLAKKASAPQRPVPRQALAKRTAAIAAPQPLPVPTVAAQREPAPRAERVTPRPSNVTPSSPNTLIGVRKIVPAAAGNAPAELQRPKTLSPPPNSSIVARTPPRPAPQALALHRADECARRHGFGTPDAELRRAITAALAGNDALLVTAQRQAVEALALAAAEQIQQPTLLISPLASALHGFAERFGGAGLPVYRVDGGVAAPERAKALARVEKSGACLLLLGPAELRAPDVVRALSRSLVGLCIIDEAHAVSSFAHELRPSMARLGSVLTTLGSPPVVAAMRPVPAAIRHDVVDRLNLRRPQVCEHALFGDEVVLSSYVARGEIRQARLLELLQRLPPPGIIFCALPHDVDAVYAGLAALRLAAHRHHSGLAPAERARELEAWSAPGRRAIMVATSGFAAPSGALGLGEDSDPALCGFGRARMRRDVRFVIHYQSPPSLEQYVREIALAGADGERADAVLLHESAHRSLNDALLAQQRFRPQHLTDLARTLETAAVEGKPLTIEALALNSGQSRRTMDRLTSLVADAGFVEKVAGWVKPTVLPGELSEGCRKLGAELGDLRGQDARRLDAVGEYTEAHGCRAEALSRYFGQAQARCGRCSHCAPVSSASASSESSVPLRRPAVQSFSVSPPGQDELGPQQRARFGAPLTATLADIAGRS